MQKCYHSGIAHRYDLYSYQLYYSASVDNIFLKYSSCFVSFSSRWDQVVSLLVQKPQNFTEQKMFQTDLRTQVCGPKIVYIVYTHVIQNVGNTLIVSIPLKIMLK